MKKVFSGAMRWMLVTLLIMMIVAGSVYAYKALTATGDVTIEECLSFVGPSVFTMNMYPGETGNAQLIVANASTAEIGVDLTSTVVPDPVGGGITVTIPKIITAPAEGQVTIGISVDASKSAIPQAYTITIDFER